jgi:hypothetical protein
MTDVTNDDDTASAGERHHLADRVLIRPERSGQRRMCCKIRVRASW